MMRERERIEMLGQRQFSKSNSFAPDAQRRQRGAFALGLEAFVSVPPADLDPAPLDAF